VNPALLQGEKNPPLPPFLKGGWGGFYRLTLANKTIFAFKVFFIVKLTGLLTTFRLKEGLQKGDRAGGSSLRVFQRGEP
jgi:hypothetical protein